jgi:hypothetical protein
VLTYQTVQSSNTRRYADDAADENAQKARGSPAAPQVSTGATTPRGLSSRVNVSAKNGAAAVPDSRPSFNRARRLARSEGGVTVWLPASMTMDSGDEASGDEDGVCCMISKTLDLKKKSPCLQFSL